MQAGGADSLDGDDGVGGGDSSMIYLEYLEALAAVACYKHVNPYIPLSTRIDTFFREGLTEGANKILKRRRN